MLHSIKTETLDVLDSLKSTQINKNNIFVFAVGYEQRSIAIFKKYIKGIDIPKICFLFDDYDNFEIAKDNKRIAEDKSVELIKVGYKNNDKVIDVIVEKIEELKKNTDKFNLHIDYSSMPRSWYCNIPIKINTILRPYDKVFFWYCEGHYEKKAEVWPSAGIEDVYVFYGKSSLRPINNRSHIIGLGFDSIRTQAIQSVLDPGFLVVTCSYPPYNEKLRDVILSKNKSLINTSAFAIELPVDDFEFSISKLYETVKELYDNGDVILVPDGPKPQILATSLIPYMINKTGIICLHIKRHEGFYQPLNVKAKKGVFGFSYSIDNASTKESC